MLLFSTFKSRFFKWCLVLIYKEKDLRTLFTFGFPFYVVLPVVTFSLSLDVFIIVIPIRCLIRLRKPFVISVKFILKILSDSFPIQTKDPVYHVIVVYCNFPDLRIKRRQKS